MFRWWTASRQRETQQMKNRGSLLPTINIAVGSHGSMQIRTVVCRRFLNRYGHGLTLTVTTLKVFVKNWESITG
jgi:hypothetical protein